tara:strand:- start:11856 stop:12017 length:162 start_codon:yes stop_codon:yes gene_type:complete
MQFVAKIKAIYHRAKGGLTLHREKIYLLFASVRGNRCPPFFLCGLNFPALRAS